MLGWRPALTGPVPALLLDSRETVRPNLHWGCFSHYKSTCSCKSFPFLLEIVVGKENGNSEGAHPSQTGVSWRWDAGAQVMQSWHWSGAEAQDLVLWVPLLVH